MAESSPIPIICCGKREEVGRLVIDGLKPEVEGSHATWKPLFDFLKLGLTTHCVT